MKKKILTLLLSAVTLFAACGGEKKKANYKCRWLPNKPVNVVISYKAGGGTDVGARILMAEAQKNFPQTFVIVNKPGADGGNGIYWTFRNSKPDGYTIQDL